MAGNHTNPGPSNGHEVGRQTDRLVSEGRPHEEAAVSYERYRAADQPVIHREPTGAKTDTNPLSANCSRNG